MTLATAPEGAAMTPGPAARLGRVFAGLFFAAAGFLSLVRRAAPA